jgi:hypothetical protein
MGTTLDIKELQRWLESVRKEYRLTEISLEFLNEYLKERGAKIIGGSEHKADVSGNEVVLPLEEIKEAIKKVKDAYPENLFPKNGKSQDCKSAYMARVTCDNILNEIESRANGNDR